MASQLSFPLLLALVNYDVFIIVPTAPYENKKAGPKCLTSKAEHRGILHFREEDQFSGSAAAWPASWKTSVHVERTEEVVVFSIGCLWRWGRRKKR